MGPKKDKKMKKKAKKNLFDDDDEEDVEMKRKAEEERIERERLRLEMEKELKEMKKFKKRQEKKEMYEEDVREKILQSNCLFFDDFRKARKVTSVTDRNETIWREYADCTGQPFPYDPPSLNTYIYAFHETEETGSFEKVNVECEKLIDIMERMDKYIDQPLDFDGRLIGNLREAKGSMCDEIIQKFDCATFQAIMNIGEYFEKLSFWSVEALRRSDKFLFWLWGWVVGDSVERKKKNIFKDTMPKRKTDSFTIRLPRSFKYRRLHLRIVRVSYDLFSWRAVSFDQPKNPEQHHLYKETLNMRERELKILKEHSAQFDKTIMPWWFLEAYPLTEQKDLKPITPESSVTATVAMEEVEDEEDLESLDIYSTISNISTGDHYNQVSAIDKKDDEVCERKSLHYSLSMLDLRRKRSRDCKGKRFYDEPDPIDFLEPNLTAKDYPRAESSESENEIEEYRSERHTTFKATLYSGAPQQAVATQYLKAIKSALSGSDNFSEGDVLEGDKREFLDWESWRDYEVPANEIEESIYDILYGEKGKGEVRIMETKEEEEPDKKSLRAEKRKSILTLSRRSKNEPKIGSIVEKVLIKQKIVKLRTLRDFIEEVTPRKALDTLNMPDDVRKNLKNILNQPPRTEFLNVTTPSEMRAFDDEVASLLQSAKDSYSTQYKSELMVYVDGQEINLRQYSIVGGVYLVDLIHDETQPLLDTNGITTQIHYGEYELKKWTFYAEPVVHFDAALAAERQLQAARKSSKASPRPSSISLKRKEIETVHKEIDLEDDETIHVNLRVFDKAIWYEDPVPVLWNEEMKFWSTKDTYDPKFSRDEDLLFFKLGKTSLPLGLASRRWWNLPYFEFTLTPGKDFDTKPSVVFILTAKLMTFEFIIYEKCVVLKNVTCDDPKRIKHIIGVNFTIYDLIKEMKRSNLDIFPDWDTFLYVKTSLQKCKSLEDHMYMCMAFASASFAFSQSVWNSMVASDKIVLQLREWSSPTYRCVIATPLKAYFGEASEDSPGFLDEPREPGTYYRPDLKSLIELVGTQPALRRMYNAPGGLVDNVYQMISGTKILTYT